MIKTFAFIDLEATGLPSHEENLTRITELAIVACSAESINSGKYPRVVHKLILCFNPIREITQKAKQMTHLDNDMLARDAQPFNENTAQLLDSFYKQLPGPVCLVAHNGNNFDYPLLQTHLNNTKHSIPINVKCCDSYVVFKKTLVDQYHYTLSSIYKRLTKSHLENAHTAEADAIALMMCALQDKNFTRVAEETMRSSTHIDKLIPINIQG